MKRKTIIFSLSLFFWAICSCVALAAPLPLHDNLGAEGLAERFNEMTFEKKSVFVTSCRKLPEFNGEEIYMLETNIGDKGDNLIMVYPNADGLIRKILIMARKDSSVGTEKMFDAMSEECVVLFNAAFIDRTKEDEIKKMLQAVVQSLRTGKADFYSAGTARRYIIDTFERKSNNIIYGNVRITAQD